MQRVQPTCKPCPAPPGPPLVPALAATAAHLDVPVGKEVLHQGSIGARHAGMVDAKPIGQQLTKVGILHALRLSLQGMAEKRAGRGVIEAHVRAPGALWVQTA